MLDMVTMHPPELVLNAPEPMELLTTEMVPELMPVDLVMDSVILSLEFAVFVPTNPQLQLVRTSQGKLSFGK